MPTVLLTGANRGIGLALTRQYAEEGWRVHACCRTPSEADELREVSGDVTIHALDVTDHQATDRLAAALDEPIDVVIANAGVYGPDSDVQTFGALDFEGLRATLETNVLGALKTCQAFLPHVEKGTQKKIVAITSKMGSIGDASGGMTAYRASKAALNAAIAVAGHDMKAKGIAMAVLHPGWVRTRMGGPNGLISPEESAEGLRARIAEIRPSDKAPFLAYDGKEIPW